MFDVFPAIYLPPKAIIYPQDRIMKTNHKEVSDIKISGTFNDWQWH
jgi:hypothetical protein